MDRNETKRSRRSQHYRFNVSGELFDEMVQAIAAHSQKARRFDSLSKVAMAAIKWAKNQDFDVEELDNFITWFKVDGSHCVALTVAPTSVDVLTEIRSILSDKVGKKLAVRETLAYVMVSYRAHVEASATTP